MTILTWHEFGCLHLPGVLKLLLLVKLECTYVYLLPSVLITSYSFTIQLQVLTLSNLYMALANDIMNGHGLSKKAGSIFVIYSW